MRHRLVLLPVLLATLVCVSPAHAWTWPQDGPVLQPFVLGGDPYAAGQHRGIDVAGPPGAAVRAPTAGTVSFAGFVPSGGRTVTIQTADGLAVTLLHLGSLGVVRGTTVAEGATVGTLAAEGDADHPVPYVQMGVRVAADPQGYLDPLVFLPARPPAEAPAAPVEEPAPDPVEEIPADPQASAPAVGAAPPDVPLEVGDPVAPAAPGAVAVPIQGGGAVVASPASAGRAGSVSRGSSAVVAARPEARASSSESGPAVESTLSVDRTPAEPAAAPSQVEPVEARAASHEPRGGAPGILAVLTAFALVTASTVAGWMRWRHAAPAPARIPPRRSPAPRAAAEAVSEQAGLLRALLPGSGSPERRHARSGPHADSPVAALLRRARRSRREAPRAA